MKILFVVGGSYKAFYLNNIHKFKRLDFIVFQENILYEFDYYNEYFGDKTITNEMVGLARKFKCKIVAKIKTNLCGIKKDEILYCDKNGVKLINNNRFLELFVKNKQIYFSNNFLYKKSNCFVYFFKNKNDFNQSSCINNNFNNRKSAIFVCDKYGVNLIYNKIITRKFRKICYFSLNF